MICQMLHNVDAVAASDDEWRSGRASRYRQDRDDQRPRTSARRHGLRLQLFRADGLPRKNVLKQPILLLVAVYFAHSNLSCKKQQGRRRRWRLKE